MYSGQTSTSVAPIVFIFINPCIPGVDGMIYAIDFIDSGIAVHGQEIPEIKMNITLVNTNNGIPNSRCEQK